MKVLITTSGTALTMSFPQAVRMDELHRQKMPCQMIGGLQVTTMQSGDLGPICITRLIIIPR